MNKRPPYIETRTEYELLLKDELSIIEDIAQVQEMLDSYVAMLKTIRRKK